MTVSDYVQKSSPKERKANKLQQASRCLLPNVKEPGGGDDGNCDTDEEMEVYTDYSVSFPMQFVQLTRELEGLPSTETFKFLFNYVSEKARSMRGGKQTTLETPQPPSPFELATSFVKGGLGSQRKLRLEEELIIVDLNET